MSLDAAFEDFMFEQVTHEQLLANSDGYGGKSYGSGRSIRCRIEQRSKLTRDAQGKEVVSNTTLLLKPVAEDGTTIVVGPSDRFTLPAGYTPQQPPIISVERHNDEGSLHHWAVLL